MTGAKESTRSLNAYLDALQNKVYGYKALLQGEMEISAEEIKNKKSSIRLHL